MSEFFKIEISMLIIQKLHMRFEEYKFGRFKSKIFFTLSKRMFCIEEYKTSIILDVFLIVIMIYINIISLFIRE